MPCGITAEQLEVGLACVLVHAAQAEAVDIKVLYSRFFLRGACLGGWAEPTPKELCLHNSFGVVRIE